MKGDNQQRQQRKLPYIHKNRQTREVLGREIVFLQKNIEKKTKKQKIIWRKLIFFENYLLQC